MTDDKLNKILLGAGKSCFVRDYDIFVNNDTKPAQKCVELQDALRTRGEDALEPDSASTKVSKATRIIKEGLTQRALRIVLRSRVESDVIAKAEILLKKLDAAK